MLYCQLCFTVLNAVEDKCLPFQDMDNMASVCSEKCIVNKDSNYYLCLSIFTIRKVGDWLKILEFLLYSIQFMVFQSHLRTMPKALGRDAFKVKTQNIVQLTRDEPENKAGDEQIC